MKIGVIGNGVVGNATAKAWAEHCDEVRVYDVDKSRSTHWESVVLESDVVFLCLPETKVEFYVSSLPAYAKERNFVIKSTVPIGTTRKLSEKYSLRNLVHSPEFLTARVAAFDASNPPVNVVGASDLYSGQWLESLYRRRWPHVPVLWMLSDESEAMKLFLNSFYAAKVAYFNEVNALATKLGLNWERVLSAMLAVGRIHPSHTMVPGPDGKYGFGGACLPKDLHQLIQHDPIAMNLCRAAYSRNEEDRKRA